jgi:hypothetical protein
MLALLKRSVLPIFLATIFLPASLYSQCNPVKTKMMVVGDSWAFFSWSGDSYNENLDNYGLSDMDCFSNTTFAVNGAQANNYFTDANRVQDLTDYINSNPDLEYVHFSLGGNDVLGTWNINYTTSQKDSLLEVVMAEIKTGIDIIHGINPDLKILIAGYDFPNFDETVGNLPGLVQQLHPFYGLWDSMGQPNAEQLNNLLTDATTKFENYAPQWHNVYFVNNLGLMQNTYGQDSPLSVPPGGTYAAGSVTVPGGLLNYPSPLDALNLGGNDSFHLNDDAYEVFVGRHFSEFYWEALRNAHQTVYASDTTKNGWTSVDSTGSVLQIGNGNFDSQELVLHFDTAPLFDNYTIQQASIFIQRDSVDGTDLIPEDLIIAVKTGFFGTIDTVEVDDYSDAGDADDVACVYGSLSEDGNWLRIDVPPSLLSYIDQNGTTEFKLSYDVADSSRTISFGNRPEDVILDIVFTENPFASIAEEKQKELNIYPNPADNWIKLDDSYDYVRFYSLRGELVYEVHQTDQIVDVSTLRSGLYIIRAQDENRIFSSRFIKN